MLLIDYLKGDFKTSFGGAEHYRSRREYQDQATLHAFRSQAKSIQNDLLAVLPCDREIEMFVNECKTKASHST